VAFCVADSGVEALWKQARATRNVAKRQQHAELVNPGFTANRTQPTAIAKLQARTAIHRHRLTRYAI
jgi:hypothetical protein